MVARCRLHLRLYQAESLKDQRREVRSLVDRLRRKFNVSVAQLDGVVSHRDIVLGISCISNEHGQVVSTLDTVVRWVESHSSGELIDSDIEVF